MKNLTLKQLLSLVAVCGLSLGGLEAKKPAASKPRDAHHGDANHDEHHGVATEQARGSRAGTVHRGAALEAGRRGKPQGPALTKPSGGKKIGKNKAHGKKRVAKKRANKRAKRIARTRRVARRGGAAGKNAVGKNAAGKNAVGKNAAGKGGVRPGRGNGRNIAAAHRIEDDNNIENNNNVVENTDN